MGSFPDELILEPKPAEPPKQNGNRFPRWGMVVALLLLAALTFDKVVEWVGGEPRLSEKQQRKLQEELRQIDESEQYALVAENDGWYTCLACPKLLIFLHEGEVWKYGVTRKGQMGRYTDEYLSGQGLLFAVQFTGTLSECLKEEKRKIYSYPILPENLVRTPSERLVNPPGNLRTD